MRKIVVAAGVLAGIALHVGAPSAAADVDTMVVDTTSADVLLDDCTGAAADCSLAGAFAKADDADAAGQTDQITFNAAIFDGTEASATIALADSLESDEALELGLNCALDKPCVGIDGPLGTGIEVTGGSFAMNGLAIYDSGSQGLFANAGSSGIDVENSWFGLSLNGTVDGNGTTGITVTGDNAVIGGSDPSEENVFVGNDIGVMLFSGADDVQILGNLFGVRPNNALAPNTVSDIAVHGSNTPSVTPTGVVIGGAPDGTPECDGACNVIGANGGPTSEGIDFVPDPGIGMSTATDVQILGNHIGVRAGGETPIGDANRLINIGSADSVTIAGNRVAGGANQGIVGQAGTDDLVIEDNAIGLNLAGDAVIAGPPGDQINVISTAGAPAEIRSNSIARATVGNMVLIGGSGPKIIGNEIGLPGVSGSGGDDGIAMFAGDATVKENEISETTGNGIQLASADGSVIGGKDKAEANVIEDTGLDAIRAPFNSGDGISFEVNLGSGAGGLFIDLEGDDGPGNGAGGPNDGIKAPVIKSAVRDELEGKARDKAKIWIYKSRSSSGDVPTGLKKLIDTVKADGKGEWKYKPKPKLSKGIVVTALQTDRDDNSSELSKGAKVKKG